MAKLFLNNDGAIIQRDTGLMYDDECCCDRCCVYRLCGDAGGLYIGTCLPGINIGDTFTNFPITGDPNCYVLILDDFECTPPITIFNGPHIICPDCGICPCDSCFYCIGEKDVTINGITSQPSDGINWVDVVSDIRQSDSFQVDELIGVGNGEMQVCSYTIQPTPFYSYGLDRHYYSQMNPVAANGNFTIGEDVGELILPGAIRQWQGRNESVRIGGEFYWTRYIEERDGFDLRVSAGVAPGLNPGGFPYSFTRCREHVVNINVNVGHQATIWRCGASWSKEITVPAGSTIFDFNPITLDLNYVERDYRPGVVPCDYYRLYAPPFCPESAEDIWFVPEGSTPIDSPTCQVTLEEVPC